MLITRAIKSLIDGVTTNTDKLVNPKYMIELDNFNLVDGSGIHKRPPAETIALEIDSFIQDNPNVGLFDFWWVKQFTMYDEPYFLLHMWENLLTLTLVIDTNGNKFTVTNVAPVLDETYLRATSAEIDLTVNGSTIYLTHTDEPIFYDAALRTQFENSYLVVKKAPAYGTEITISYNSAGGGTGFTTAITVAGDPYLSRTGTDYVAAQIATAINQADNTLSNHRAVVRGSVVMIDNDTADGYTNITVNDGDNNNTVQAINGTVGEAIDLMRYAFTDNGASGDLEVVTIDRGDNDIYMAAEQETFTLDNIPVQTMVITAGTATVGSKTYTGYNTVGSEPVIGGINSGSISINGITLEQILTVTDTANPTYNELLIKGSGTGFTEADAIKFISIFGVNMYTAQTTFVRTAGGGLYTFGTDLWNNGLAMVSTNTYTVNANHFLDGNTADVLQKVKWKETSKTGETYKLDPESMPKMIEFDSSWEMHNIDWDEKRAGDNTSNPTPDFVAGTGFARITNLSLFQNRLVALVGDLVNTTETDNLFSWWRSTVSQLLPTHPVRMFSTAQDSSVFHTAINHNKDLLIFSKSKQYKLPGDIPLTPNSGLPMTTTYPSLPDAKPLSLGNDIYFPFLYSKTSTGLGKYTPAANTEARDKITSVTDHVKGYLPNNLAALLGDASVGRIIVPILGTNDLYVLEYDEISQGVSELRTRKAWHKWSIAELDQPTEIMEAIYHDAKLTLLVLRLGNRIDMLQVEMTDSPQTDDRILHLDYTATAITDATGQANFTSYDISTTAILTFADTAHAEHGRAIKYNKISNISVLVDPVELPGIPTGTELIIGEPYTAAVTLPKQYVRDQGGKVNFKSRLTVQQFLVHMENSADVNASLVTKLLDTHDDQYWSGLVAGGFATFAEQLANESTVFQVAVGERGDLAQLRLHSTGQLPLHISQIEYLGSYSSRGRRF